MSKSTPAPLTGTFKKGADWRRPEVLSKTTIGPASSPSTAIPALTSEPIVSQTVELTDKKFSEAVNVSAAAGSSRASSWLTGENQRATLNRAPLPGMVAINLRLPPDLHEELKILAFTGRTSLQKLIIEAIEAKLQGIRPTL